MELPLVAKFTDRASGAIVHGIVRLATEEDFILWTRWRYRESDEDRDWDWWSIYVECQVSRGRYECYAALAANDLQGLMVLDLEAKTVGIGKVITIDYLSSNPANRQTDRGIKYVGVALLAAAVVRGRECTARGAIWLESLEGAASFYENLAMTRQPGRSGDGHLIYILEPTRADQLLEEIKASGILQL